MESVLERVREQMKPFPMQPGCPETELQSLPQAIRQQLGADVPRRYLDLLRITDGFEQHALDVFGSKTQRNVLSDRLGYDVYIHGILDANREYRMDLENYDQLLLFAYRGGIFLGPGDRHRSVHQAARDAELSLRGVRHI